MNYTSDNLLIHPNPSGDVIIYITPASAGWSHLHFQARRLATGAHWQHHTGETELALVNLDGVYRVSCALGSWIVGGRASVFAGPAHALVLPRRTQFEVTAVRGGEFALIAAETDRDIAPLFVQPSDVRINLRGADNMTRQINDIVPAGSPVHKLVLVEVYTPPGNWSSFPPHKHDQHVVGAEGRLTEAALEEVYFFKTDRPDGAVWQRVYTDANSPGHAAGRPIDATMLARNNCAVLVPEGYHPVVSWPGTTAYCLTVLAGSAQSLANQEDPLHSWVKQTWRAPDSRLPLY